MYSKCESMLIYVRVPAQEDLTVVLCIHDIYNVDMIAICVIKLHGRTLSHLRVETQ